MRRCLCCCAVGVPSFLHCPTFLPCGTCQLPRGNGARNGSESRVASFALRLLCHFEFIFLFSVRISFSVRETRPLRETLCRCHEGHGRGFFHVKRTEGDRQPDYLLPAGVFLVAVSLCSSAVLEHVVVGQAMVTVSLVFSANFFPRRSRR